MLLEATTLLIKLSDVNKEMEDMKEPYVYLIEKKKSVEQKVEDWLANNVVETD